MTPIIAKFIIVFALTIFFSEHFMRTYFTDSVRPSVVLNLVNIFISDFFKKVGIWIAFLSNITKLLDLIPFDELKKTFQDLIYPGVDIFISPFQILIGYIEAIQEYYCNFPGLIVCGTIILFCSVAVLLVFITRRCDGFKKFYDRFADCYM